MGAAFSAGQQDGTLGREKVMKHISEIASSTALPISADLENGFGDSPETAAETIRLAAAAGAVGGSIEDASGDPDHPIYDREHATERIRAAADTVRSLPFSFTLTGRADNYLHGRPDLADTIARLQAYQEAGAQVLYAPGLTSREEIATIVRSVDRPVNVLMGLRGEQLSLDILSAIGVKRVSVGSTLCRAPRSALSCTGCPRDARARHFCLRRRRTASTQEISAIFKAAATS